MRWALPVFGVFFLTLVVMALWPDEPKPMLDVLFAEAVQPARGKAAPFEGARQEQAEAVPTKTVPVFNAGPELPRNYHRGSGSRLHVTDEMYASWLDARSEWKGAIPKGVKSLPGAAKAKLDEAGDDDQVDYQLKMLSELEQCVDGRIKDGAVMAAFMFSVKNKTAMGSSVEVEASTLPAAEEELFLKCARQIHLSGSFAFEGKARQHVWPTTIPFPINQHTMVAYFMENE